jgi:hypothetical protein
MSFPRIETDDVIVESAKAEKTYPDKYITAFGVRRHASNTLVGVVELQAYNFDTKEMSDDPGQIQRVKFPDLWADAQRSPVVQDQLQSWVTVLALLYRDIHLREKIAGMEDGPERDTKIIVWNGVQTQLQINPLEDPPPPFVPNTVWAK